MKELLLLLLLLAGDCLFYTIVVVVFLFQVDCITEKKSEGFFSRKSICNQFGWLMQWVSLFPLEQSSVFLGQSATHPCHAPVLPSCGKSPTPSEEPVNAEADVLKKKRMQSRIFWLVSHCGTTSLFAGQTLTKKRQLNFNKSLQTTDPHTDYCICAGNFHPCSLQPSRRHP